MSFLLGLSKPEFNGVFGYQFRQIIGKNYFPYHFKKIIICYKTLVFKYVLQETAELRARVGRPQTS